jgi:hypothetical protein
MSTALVHAMRCFIKSVINQGREMRAIIPQCCSAFVRLLTRTMQRAERRDLSRQDGGNEGFVLMNRAQIVFAKQTRANDL